MSEHYNPDILRHLRNRNPCVHSTAYADLPKEPMTDPSSNNSNNANQVRSISNMYGSSITRNNNQVNNNFNNIMRPPSLIMNKPIEIIKMGGKTIAERTRSTDLVCEPDLFSIMTELKNLLRKEEIMLQLDNFVFGYCETAKS